MVMTLKDSAAMISQVDSEKLASKWVDFRINKQNKSQ